MVTHVRQAALVGLKESLVRQFGPSSREIVEAVVEGRLVGRARLDREDLDAIESSILAAKRQRRGKVGTRSAPDLMHTRPVEATSSAPSVSSTAPPSLRSLRSPAPGSRHSTAKQTPVGGSFLAAVSQRSPTLGRPLGPSTSEVRLLQPPYGVLVTDVRDDMSERSHVQVQPKYFVPLRPKLKAMDHWDLIVAFDAEKHRHEEEQFLRAGKSASHAKFKAALDNQMEEIRTLREQEADLKRQEQDAMVARIEENKRLAESEENATKVKRDKMKMANDEMTSSLQLRKQKQRERQQREQEQMVSWLQNEKTRTEEEENLKRQGFLQKCKVAQEELMAARLEAEHRRKTEQELDKAIAVEQVKAMDNNEADKAAALQARMDQIERNTRTLGAEIAARDARMERELETKIKRVQEENDRLTREDAERRRNEHKRKVKEMLRKLDEQVREREEFGLIEKRADVKQAEIWRQQREEAERAEQAKIEKMRKAREEQDGALIKQIRESVAVHPRNYGITAQTQKADVAYNRVFFERMADEGFRGDLMDKMLEHVCNRGKMDPFPSVSRYGGPIHPLEMQFPDV